MAVQYRAGGDIFGRLNIFGDLYVNDFPVSASLKNIHVVTGADLPSTNNVIFLSANTSYTFMGAVDLSGKRLVCEGDVAIKGVAPNISVLRSTGLSPLVPLLSSSYSIAFSELTFADRAYVMELDSANPLNAITTYATNFLNCSAVGSIKGYNNTSFNTGIFTNSGGLRFDGNCGTVSMFLYAFQPPVGSVSVIAMSSINVSRRLRVFYSSMIVNPGSTGVLVQSGATIPGENLILDNVNFSNGGTYLSGVDNFSPISRIQDCIGVANSSTAAQLYMSNNIVPTVILNTTDYYKMSGSADIGSKAEKFINGNSRLTYTGGIQRDFIIDGVASMGSGNNNVCYMAIAKNGIALSASKMPTTTSGTGRSENIKTQVYAPMLSGDYIEVFVRNSTGANNITVTDVNLRVQAL